VGDLTSGGEACVATVVVPPLAHSW
jgi:hypothetical protein